VKDPQRIPEMVNALARLWKARPDLSLTQVLGLLETHGLGWNATDEETLDVLRSLSARTPANLRDVPGALLPDGTVAGNYLITTENSAGDADRLITLYPDRVAVRHIPHYRSEAVHHPQPVIWDHDGIQHCLVASPLIIPDTEGIPHRLGLVSSITILALPGNELDITSLDRRHRQRLDGVYLLELDDAIVLLDRTLQLFTTDRRHLHREQLDWAQLLTCTVGAPVRIALTGGEVRNLPTLHRITLLE